MPRIIEVTGTVIEVAPAVQFPEKSGNITYRHPYVIIEDDDGEAVRASDVITNQEVEGQLKVGKYGTYYFRESRIYNIMLGISNILIATKTDDGIRSHIISTSGLASILIMMIVASPLLVFFGYISIGWFFWDSMGSEIALFISAWPIWGFLIYVFLVGRLKADASGLKRRLTRNGETRVRV